jgi:hypothetical protein
MRGCDVDNRGRGCDTNFMLSLFHFYFWWRSF